MIIIRRLSFAETAEGLGLDLLDCVVRVPLSRCQLFFYQSFY